MVAAVYGFCRSAAIGAASKWGPSARSWGVQENRVPTSQLPTSVTQVEAMTRVTTSEARPRGQRIRPRGWLGQRRCGGTASYPIAHASRG